MSKPKVIVTIAPTGGMASKAERLDHRRPRRASLTRQIGVFEDNESQTSRYLGEDP